MNLFSIVLVAAATFGICYLLDRGFIRLFRNKAQHRSGKSVRVSKRYGSFGLILCVLGIAAVLSGLTGGAVLLAGGVIVFLIGCCLIGYYMSFSIFYDDDSFILTTFGRKSVTYRFGDIRHQKLYLIQGGGIVIELHLADGQSVSIQSAMDGAYPFLDHAFFCWCRQTRRESAGCAFHDPANHLWFPVEEDA